MHAHACTHIHAHTYTHSHTRAHACMHVHIHAKHACARAHTHSRMHAHTYIHAHTYARAHALPTWNLPEGSTGPCVSRHSSDLPPQRPGRSAPGSPTGPGRNADLSPVEMTQHNSAGRGPRGEQRRQRAGPASPARRPGPTLPRGQEPTGGNPAGRNPAGRAQARRPPRRPSPSNEDAHSPAGPNGEVIDRVETRGPEPRLSAGGRQPLRRGSRADHCGPSAPLGRLCLSVFPVFTSRARSGNT